MLFVSLVTIVIIVPKSSLCRHYLGKARGFSQTKLKSKLTKTTRCSDPLRLFMIKKKSLYVLKF